ncbi:response regulator [bacterium]|nr:response regulator [bacterium]
MKLRTLIVDDESPARKRIRHFLELDSEIELIGECENGQDALAWIRTYKPDILFLDIQMPLMDGFNLLKRSGLERQFSVIFITAYDEYAVKAFEANAADYLLKPFTRKRFEEALRKVKQQIRLKRNSEPAEQAMALLQTLQKENEYLQRIAVKSTRGIIFVSCNQVDWIESEDNYILVHAGKETHIIRESMNAIEQALDPARFLRIHRRILVNTDRIREMQPQRQTHLILQNGTALPVSRRLKEKVKRFLFRK